MKYRFVTLPFLLVVASLPACGSPTAEGPVRPGPGVVEQPPPEVNLEEARELARAVQETARGQAIQVIEGLPTPSWSRYPGLEAPRVRESLTFDANREGPRPVLLLMLDTTRADRLSFYGHDRATSPNLDAVADQGVRFSRFYANAAWTRPSIASMFTSRYRADHGVEVSKAVLDPEFVTVAEVFADNGYATAAFIGNQTVSGKHGFDQGFSRFDDIFDEIDHDPDADVLTDRARRWLQNNDNENWFMWLFVVDPHDPYEPRSEFDKWPTNYRGKVSVPRAEYAKMPSKSYVDRMLSLYDAEILQMDNALGELFATLEELGQWDDLTIVVVADHGEAFGENKCFRHPYHFWEPNVNVPLVIRSPAFKDGHGMVEDRLASGVDIAPTLFDLAGLEEREGFDPHGISLVDMLTGPITDGWDRAVYAELHAYGLRRAMVRWGNFKYLHFDPTHIPSLAHFWKNSHRSLATANHKNTRRHLFNVAIDPREEKDLARSEPELMRHFADELRRFRDGRARIPVASDDRDVDEETLEELRSLGYAE